MKHCLSDRKELESCFHHCKSCEARGNQFKVAGNPAFSRSTYLESKLIEFFVFVNV